MQSIRIRARAVINDCIACTSQPNLDNERLQTKEEACFGIHGGSADVNAQRNDSRSFHGIQYAKAPLSPGALNELKPSTQLTNPNHR
jgi:hypothetical protein